jgi:hypothetical protein
MDNRHVGYIYRWEQPQPSLADLVHSLRNQGQLPPEQSWWFGWCELEIALPGRLTESTALPAQWDVVHLFSPQVEVRWLRQHDQWGCWLLTEGPAPAEGWRQTACYTTQCSKRILWGNRLRMPDGEARGVVQFPRKLVYDVADEQGHYDQALVADVRLYYDQEHRLQTVRYMALRHQAPDANPRRN